MEAFTGPSEPGAGGGGGKSPVPLFQQDENLGEPLKTFSNS